MNRQDSYFLNSGKTRISSARTRALSLFILGLGFVFLTASGANAQVISQIVPASGPMAGGNVVRLLGSGFTASTSVWFWASQVGAQTLVSANELDVIVPAHTAAGPVDVAAGAGRINNGYTYTNVATPTLKESATSLAFGSANVGTAAATKVLTLTSSGTAPVSISRIALAGAGYSIIGGSLNGVPIASVVYPVTLNPGAQGTITFQFKPTAAGASNGTFSVYSNSNSGSTLSASLTGTGVAAANTPKLAITPASANLGSVVVGKAAAQTITLTSSGTAPVVVNSVAAAGAGYTVSGMTFPATLAVGQTASLVVQFKPASAGTVAGQVSVASNGGTPVAALSGTGTAATTGQGTPLSACGELAQSGSYYLTQNVTSAGTCFFVDADNISLNLSGYTITYATGGGAKPTPGVLLADPWYTFVAKSGSTSTHSNFEIYGGTITESKSGAAKSAAIWVGQSTGIAAPKVHDLTLTTYTQDASPIYGDISDSGWQIYNNKIYYSSTTTSSRYAFYGVAIWIGNQEQAPGPYTDLIYNNFIYTAPQGGIRDTHQNAKIYSNDITFNSLYTNDFCVDAPADLQQVYSNNCHPTSGRGVHTAGNNVWIHDNVITVQELKQNAEYGGCELGGAYGIQVEFDNSFTAAPPTGVQVANNVIKAIAADCNAVGLRLTSMTASGSVTYASNTVTTTNNGGAGLDYGFSFSADVEGTNRFLFTTNTFQSQHAYVTVDWDGANVIIPAGQTWLGTPTYAVDNENGFLDQAEGGPTFTQAVTLGDAVKGTINCGPYASGMQKVGATSQQCN
jgi:hypothetical protein